MRIRNRSLIIMFTRGLTQATTLVLFIVLVRMISKEAVGTFRQVALVNLFLSGMLSLQLHNSLYYFLPKHGSAMRRTLLAQTVLASLVMSGIVALVMFFGADLIARRFSNPELAPLLRIYALYPFFNRVSELVPAFMISLDRPLRGGLFALLRAVGHTGGAVATFAMGYDITTVVTVLVAFEAVVATAGFADMARFSTEGRWGFNRKLMREQLEYCWPLLANGIVANVNVQFGNLLIASFFDPEVYAVYSCGAMEVPLVALVTGSVYAALMPNLVTSLAKGRKDTAMRLWHEAARKCSLVIFPCFVFLLVTSTDLIVLMYGQAYAMAVWPFAIYLMRLPLRVAVYATLFRAAGRTKPIALSAGIGLLVNVAVSSLLVWAGQMSLLSYIGPAIGDLCSTIAVVVYLLTRLSPAVEVPLPKLMRWRELGKTLAWCVVCGFVVFLIPLDWLPLPVKLGIQAVLFCGALLAVVVRLHLLQDDEVELLLLPWRMARRALGGKRRQSEAPAQAERDRHESWPDGQRDPGEGGHDEAE